MVYLIFFCFSSYTIPRTSAKSIAAKKQNLPTKKRKLKVPIMLSCMNSKKRISSLKLPDDWQTSDNQNQFSKKANLMKYPV